MAAPPRHPAAKTGGPRSKPPEFAHLLHGEDRSELGSRLPHVGTHGCCVLSRLRETGRPLLQPLSSRSRTRLGVCPQRLEALKLIWGEAYLVRILEHRPGNVGAHPRRDGLPEPSAWLRFQGVGHELYEESEDERTRDSCLFERRHYNLHTRNERPGARNPPAAPLCVLESRSAWNVSVLPAGRTRVAGRPEDAGGHVREASATGWPDDRKRAAVARKSDGVAPPQAYRRAAPGLLRPGAAIRRHATRGSDDVQRCCRPWLR